MVYRSYWQSSSPTSGAAVLRSPEIEELVRLMDSPEIHGVVAREFSRLMRPENFADYALLQVFADTASISTCRRADRFQVEVGQVSWNNTRSYGGPRTGRNIKARVEREEEKRRAGNTPRATSPCPTPLVMTRRKSAGTSSRKSRRSVKRSVSCSRERRVTKKSAEGGYRSIQPSQ